ncbi:MAG: O-methyltransferase [Solirubrobacteraceae bacterium]
MPRLKITVTEEVGEYLARHSRQDEVLARVERETAGRPDARMQITPDEGALLTMLAQLIGAERALEVGTFTGYSAICIARGLAPGGTLTCLEVSEEFAATARANLEDAGLTHRVEIRVGAAAESLKKTPEEPAYDFVFLDADKTGYPAYYELIVPRLKPGALLVLDNMLLGGRVVDPQDERTRTIDELNGRIAEDERVDSAMVLVADGLTLVRRR